MKNKKRMITLPAAVLFLFASLLFTGCETVGSGSEKKAEVSAEQTAKIQEEDAERAAEKDAEAAAEREAEQPVEKHSGREIYPGGWTAQGADNPDLRSAFEFFTAWITENWNLIDTESLPDMWKTSKSGHGFIASLKGGGTQVVSGLNLRLDLEAVDIPGMVSVYVYRDFSENYEVIRIETSERAVYTGP